LLSSSEVLADSIMLLMTLLLSQSFGLRPRFDLMCGLPDDKELNDADDDDEDISE
jgi:hypothetical protein